MAFTNPLKSNRKINCHIDIITVPPALKRFLLVLFTILLPIAHGLRSLKGQAHPFCSTHLWTMSHRRSNGHCPWLYDANEASKSLKVLTQEQLGFALSGKVIFHMAKQLFKAEFPLLFSNNMPFRSPVDDLAQHLYSTGLASYGRLATFPASPNMTGDRPIRHLSYCEIWQALVGCGPINTTWENLVKGSVLFPTLQYFPALALRVARGQVLNFYHLRKCNSPDERKESVSRFLATKPFMQGINLDSIGSEIGDPALLLVLQTLILGSAGQRDGMHVTITEHLLADSVVLLMKAFCEWSTGHYVELSHTNGGAALQFQNLHLRIMERLKKSNLRTSILWEVLESKI
ncbi:hypothetical protein BD779DRAFT_1476016 [Infundibulicybe gibba]|nr:hypothetical protein BD779DRAFT_1476016 [Infundibulicybe gibba]